ncbi:MAG TPA: hypothetical protein VM754_00605 [Actinomycetota bacterium]|nr:hypothetical protein [Actinomycetota bacterium]
MLKRPKLSKRENASSAPTSSAPTGGSSSSTPPPLPRSGGSGISPAALQAALGGGYQSPTGGGGGGGSAASGISNSELGYALTGGGTSAGNRSVASSRHTSYPLPGDLTGLPARAGTRTGPRTTSYRIPLQRGAQSNVYDTVN